MEVPKLITGFLLGVVVTLAVVSWLNSSSEIQPSVSDQYSLRDSTTAMPRGTPANSVDETTQEDVEGQHVSTSAEPVLNGAPSELQAPSSVAPQVDARSMSASQRSSARTTNDEYPPEIAEMIEKRVDKDLQARYENDEREDSWAPYMEGLLAAYFAQKPALAHFYFSLIDCRTSVCEIHALGYGLEALTQWNSATADIVSQPWFEFNNMSMNRRNPEPDILAIVLILTKKPPD